MAAVGSARELSFRTRQGQQVTRLWAHVSCGLLPRDPWVPCAWAYLLSHSHSSQLIPENTGQGISFWGLFKTEKEKVLPNGCIADTSRVALGGFGACRE